MLGTFKSRGDGLASKACHRSNICPAEGNSWTLVLVPFWPGSASQIMWQDVVQMHERQSEKNIKIWC